jgi:hypothetical protein
MGTPFHELVSWPWPALELAGLVVFAVKFRRVPLVAVLGALGFGIQAVWGIVWRVLVRVDGGGSGGAREVVFAAGSLLSILGFALVIAAIAAIPSPGRPAEPTGAAPHAP